MDRLPRFSISFSRSKRRMMSSSSSSSSTQVRKLVRQGNIQGQPQIRYHQVQQQQQQQEDQDHESISFRCRRKKAVSWASSTVDNESTPKKSFNKEYYFSRVFELNRQTYLGITPGSMQMKLVKRI